MEILGYIGAMLMGLSLGVIGAGGAILTVPILVYLFSIDAVLATTYSLFVVGSTSLFGSFGHIRQGNIDFKTALFFGAGSISSILLTRMFLLPAIPAEIFSLTKSYLILLLFAIFMLVAAYAMLFKKAESAENQDKEIDYPQILLRGVLVGTIAGMVGAGGGFLIIPALVFMAKLPMKKAVGTSLLIISVNSLIGFAGDLRKNMELIDWQLLLTFSAIAIVGILLGTYFAKYISNEKLKPAFGWFVLGMGVYIISKELFFNKNPMEHIITVENIKCAGCMNSIKIALLGLAGVKSVRIEKESETIWVEGETERDALLTKLATLGYPEKGNNNLLHKAKSFVSCAVGRVNG